MNLKRLISIALVSAFCSMNCICLSSQSSAEELCPEDMEVRAPDNLINAASGSGYDYLAINNNASLDYTVNYDNSCIDWYVKEGYESFSVKDEWRGFSGFELGNREGHPDFAFYPEGGKTYVISARIKNCSEDNMIPYFGASMNNTWNKDGAVYTNEYGADGMKLEGNGWNNFNATITLPDNYDYSLANGKKVFFGMNKEMPKGVKLQVDCSQKDSFYIAEETATHIRMSCEKKTEIKAGDVIDVKAEVLNQLNMKGTLLQNLKWYCVNEESNTTADGVVITEYEGGAKIKIKSAIDTDKIKIAAQSKDYGLVSSIYPVEMPENEKITLYVSSDGNDSASGSENKPLATLEGARDKIRNLRSKEINNAVEVIFKEGRYYFDDTADFDSRDCGTENNRIVYKAEENARVVFSGAVPLDLSSARKVSDKAVLSRLKEDVRDKIIEIDLTKNGFPYNQNNIDVTIQQLYDGFEHPELYLNSNEQMLSQWPNGKAEYSNFEVVSNDTFSYEADEPSAWTQVDDWWVGGYTSYDFSYTRHPAISVNPDSKQIRVKIDEGAGLVVGNTNQPKVSKRWKAFNLLEEIDVPTEWYIDKSAMKLYYYAPKLSADSRLEISALCEPMINLAHTDYISFENIEFENTRGNAVTITNAENVEITGCEFRNIGVSAVDISGTKNAECDKNYWQRQKIDAAYNCVIENCLFCNIGGHAAVIDGGNVDTLTAGKNIFKNNILYRCSQKIKAYEAVLVKGCGNIVENNNISACAFIAIRHYGNDHIIRHNEIYNVNQETDDTGAIYCGRNSIQRGTLISENYLHDLYSTYTPAFGHQVGIYWDDNQTGITADRNVIKDVKVNVYTNGVDNVFTNNITINAEKNLDFRNGAAASNKNDDGINDMDTFDISAINDTFLYYAKYKNLEAIVTSNSLSARKLSGYNVINRNYCTGVSQNSNAIGDYTMYPNKTWIINGKPNENVYDNIYEENTDIFVNPDVQDYRVKSASEVASKTNVLDESFDIEQIGIISENILKPSEINLISPYNGECIKGGTVRFMWDEPIGATSYTVTVARDAEFNDIAAEKTVYYNFADIPIEGEVREYYWKVTAHNNSREFASDWESDVYTFINGSKISVNAVLNADDTVDISIMNNYYREGKNVKVIIAQYSGKELLTDAQIWNLRLDYQVLQTKNIKPKIGSEASDIKLFVWDDELIPMAESVWLRGKGGV